MRGRTRSSRSSGIEVAPVRACTCSRRSSSEISPARSRRRIGRGRASGCSNGNAAATRATPRPSTAASTAASMPTSNDVSTSSCATSRARSRGVAASSASSKSTRWGRSNGVDDHVLQREVAVRDAGVVEHADLGPQLVEEGAVDARGIDSVMRSPTTRSVTTIAEPSGVVTMPTRLRRLRAAVGQRGGARTPRARSGVARWVRRVRPRTRASAPTGRARAR